MDPVCATQSQTCMRAISLDSRSFCWCITGPLRKHPPQIIMELTTVHTHMYLVNSRKVGLNIGAGAMGIGAERALWKQSNNNINNM